MRRYFKGLTALFLFAVLMIQLSGINRSVAAESNGEMITKISCVPEIALWHYSGGYWGNPGLGIRIDDSEISDEELLAVALNKRVELSIPLPDEVKTEIAKGEVVTVSCSPNNGLSLFDLFYMNLGDLEFRYDSNNLYFSVFPKFHFIYEPDYRDFVSGLNKQIPFADPAYGYNYYAIWTRGGKSLGSATGYINPKDWSELPPPDSGMIHPSQIKSKSGHLIDGFTVKYGEDSIPVRSDDVSIGYGTFHNAGAVGFVFIFPLTFSFYSPALSNDVAVTKIVETQYGANEACTAKVSVKNNGAAQITTELKFSIPSIIDKTESVTLSPGETKDILFYFAAPASGPITMTAEANKKRLFTETDYDNNKMTQVAAIVSKDAPPPDSTTCGTEIVWTENDSHKVNGVDCNHTFTYKAALTTAHTITPKTLKSGYGFEIALECGVSTTMTLHTGCDKWGSERASTKTVTYPTTVYAKVPWTVTDRLGTQGQTISLEKKAGTTGSWICKQNPISEINARKIYTDVALAGTKDSPKAHSFTINVAGGGANGVSFCKTITESITINGNMYEDDHTGGGG